MPLEVSSCYCYFWNSDFLQKPRTKTPEAPVMGISQTYGWRALQAILSDTFANLQLLQHQVWVRYVSSWCDIWLNFTCLHLQASEILWNHQHPALCKLIGLLLASKIPHLPAEPEATGSFCTLQHVGPLFTCTSCQKSTQRKTEGWEPHVLSDYISSRSQTY